ncbi:MAG: hypothetical protein H6780_03720 [Candidatus Nomurabacteria bacterium]|nr:MAG: hypothetical protein H6780_03720 [Candidatus Nomurabacteria bacterium]
MEINWMVIVYTLLLIDSMGAIIMSWFGQKWWLQYTGFMAKYFPPAKGWSLLYFVLVLVIGHLLGLL